MSVVTECGQIVTLVTKYIRAILIVVPRTSPQQLLTQNARLLQAGRAMLCRLLSAAGAKMLKSSLVGLVPPTA